MNPPDWTKASPHKSIYPTTKLSQDCEILLLLVLSACFMLQMLDLGWVGIEEGDLSILCNLFAYIVVI